MVQLRGFGFEEGWEAPFTSLVSQLVGERALERRAKRPYSQELTTEELAAIKHAHVAISGEQTWQDEARDARRRKLPAPEKPAWTHASLTDALERWNACMDHREFPAPPARYMGTRTVEKLSAGMRPPPPTRNVVPRAPAQEELGYGRQAYADADESDWPSA